MIIPQQDQIIAALKLVVSTYGMPFAKMLECLFRNETAHFQSSEWNNCFSPGMEMAKGTIAPNYGWNGLANFWLTNKPYAPIGIWWAVDNKSALSESTGRQGFLQFPSIEAAMMSVAFHIHTNKADNFGGWFDNNPTDQANYTKILNTIMPRFCNGLNPAA